MSVTHRASITNLPDERQKDRRELEDFTAPEIVDDFDLEFDFEE